MTRNRLITSVMTAIAVVALGVTALSVNSCKNKETEILVTGVKVSTPTLTINEGETATISFTVEPSNASNKGVSFTSSDTSVVTVDENGVVTAVGPGTATITITTKDGSYTATVTVTVKGKSVAVSGVSLDIVEVTIKEGDSVTLTATVKPDDAADKSVSWSSSDDAVASVADGVVTGVKAGSATITVKTNDGGKTATCAVTVEAKAVAVESVSLDKSELSLEVGEEATLTATVKPADATDKEVSWSSSDPSVATVDEGGKVVAKAPGTTAVTVTTKDGAKSASCAVTVKAKGVAVESVSLDKSELTLIVGEDATLKATVKPDDATDKSVSWASDKEAVATVDEGGKVSAKAEGEATITVTTKDGGKTATCKVTVKAAEVKVTGIKLDKSSITIGVGEEITLTPTIEPDDATNKEVTWQSNDASVAAVDETGKVTGKAAGSATIIATTKDGGFKATCSVKVTDAGVSVTGVSLNESEIVMEVGDGAKLWETVTPSTAANKKVTWSSDKPEVADVDDNGNVEAKAVGEAIITVKTVDGGFEATCKVTVVGKVISVTGVSLDKTTLTLTEGEDATLVATVKPDDASNKQVTWESDKVAVATVDENGKVTAVKAGTAVITVTTKDGGKTATCKVTVKAATVAVTGVSLDKTTLTLTAGESATLKATVTPATASNKQVTWSSDKTSIATVDANGKVTAVAAGTAVITVTTKDGGKTAKCTVTVKAATVAVTGVSLDKSSINMEVGEKVVLNATVAPSTATNKEVTWSSDKTSIATVDANGMVEAKAAGSATITVTTKDGGKKATCSVTVTAPSIELRTQFLEDKTTVATFGSVIHYKNGTNHRGTANEFLIVPWDSSKNNYVQDADASHFSCSSSKSDNVSVQVEDLGSRKAFCIKVLKNPTGASDAFSDLSFTYTSAGGTKFTKNTRVVIANSSAKSAFDYKVVAFYNKDGDYPDVSGGTFTHVMNKAGETYFLRTYIGFDATSKNPTVCDTKDMAKFEFSNSNSSVLTMAQNIQDAMYGSYPRAEYTFKGIGTSTIGIKYIDYKGNKLDKTIAVTVKKSYFESGDYVADKTNSSSNSRYIPVGQTIGVALCGDNGVYTKDQLSGFTWTSSDTSIATVTSSSEYGGYMGTITGKKAGYATITVTDGTGNKRYFYLKVYKDITAMTGNSTTFKLGKGDEHHLEVGSGKDISFTPADATFTTTYDLEFKSSNTSVTTIDEHAYVLGKGVGTATVSAKPLHSANITNFQIVRTFQVYDHSLQLIHNNPDGNNSYPAFYDEFDHKPIPAGATLKMIAGDMVNLAFYEGQTSSTSRVKLTNQSDFSTASTSGIVQFIYKVNSSTGNPYLQLKALAVGKTTATIILYGDDGFFSRSFLVEVLPKFTWASGDYASYSNWSGSSSTSPGYRLTTETTIVRAVKSGGTYYSSSEAAAITWKSSNENIATVSPAVGNLTTVTAKKAGLVEIIGTDNSGNTRSFWIQFYVPISSLTPGNFVGGYTSGSTTVNLTYATNYSVSPSNATYASIDNFYNFKSSSTALATVSSSGVVTVDCDNTGNASITASTTRAGVTDAVIYNVLVSTWHLRCGTYFGSSSVMADGSTYSSSSTIPIENGQEGTFQVQIDKNNNEIIGKANYKVTVTSGTDVISISEANNWASSNGNYFRIHGLKTGTAKFSVEVTGTYNRTTYYFKRSGYTVQVQ